jgi:hypothetical protein
MKSREKQKRNQQSRQNQPQISAAIDEHLRVLGASDPATDDGTDRGGSAARGCGAQFCLTPAGPLRKEEASSGC